MRDRPFLLGFLVYIYADPAWRIQNYKIEYKLGVKIRPALLEPLSLGDPLLIVLLLPLFFFFEILQPSSPRCIMYEIVMAA